MAHEKAKTRLVVVGLLPSQAQHLKAEHPDVGCVEVDKGLRIRARENVAIIAMTKFINHNLYETLKPEYLCTGGLSALKALVSKIKCSESSRRN